MNSREMLRLDDRQTKPMPTPTASPSSKTYNRSTDRSTVHPEVLRDGPSRTRFPNRLGKESSGLYPEASRTKLAEKVGKCIATVTGVLNGRQKPTLELAAEMARWLGVTVDQLSEELAEKQGEWAGVPIPIKRSGSGKTKSKRQTGRAKR